MLTVHVQVQRPQQLAVMVQPRLQVALPTACRRHHHPAHEQQARQANGSEQYDSKRLGPVQCARARARVCGVVIHVKLACVFSVPLLSAVRIYHTLIYRAEPPACLPACITHRHLQSSKKSAASSGTVSPHTSTYFTFNNSGA